MSDPGISRSDTDRKSYRSFHAYKRRRSLSRRGNSHAVPARSTPSPMIGGWKIAVPVPSKRRSRRDSRVIDIPPKENDLERYPTTPLIRLSDEEQKSNCNCCSGWYIVLAVVGVIVTIGAILLAVRAARRNPSDGPGTQASEKLPTQQADGENQTGKNTTGKNNNKTSDDPKDPKSDTPLEIGDEHIPDLFPKSKHKDRLQSLTLSANGKLEVANCPKCSQPLSHSWGSSSWIVECKTCKLTSRKQADLTDASFTHYPFKTVSNTVASKMVYKFLLSKDVQVGKYLAEGLHKWVFEGTCARFPKSKCVVKIGIPYCHPKFKWDWENEKAVYDRVQDKNITDFLAITEFYNLGEIHIQVQEWFTETFFDYAKSLEKEPDQPGQKVHIAAQPVAFGPGTTLRKVNDKEWLVALDGYAGTPPTVTVLSEHLRTQGAKRAMRNSFFKKFKEQAKKAGVKLYDLHDNNVMHNGDKAWRVPDFEFRIGDSSSSSSSELTA